MSKTRKILSIMLALTMAVGLSACSGKPDEPSAQQQSSGGGESSTWPEKPVTIVVPYNPGGDSDFNARLLAEKLTEKTGQTFVVENIAGNSGATGARQALKSDSDGYTMLFNHTAFVINYFSGNSDLTYDDMTFGAIVGLFPVESDVFVAQPDLGITKLSEVKKYCEEHPGELIYGASGGTTVLVAGMRMQEAGLDITMVDTGGTAERMTAILGDHVDFTCVPRGNAKDYLETGELVEIENDLGTDIICPAYYQMNFPKGVDPAIVTEFNKLVEEIITTDEAYAKTIYDTYEQKPLYMNSEEGLKHMKEMWDEFAQWDWS